MRFVCRATAARFGWLLFMLCFVALHAVAAASAPQQPRLAMGLIVKLRDGEGATQPSVVRLQATNRPKDSAQRLRLVMAAAAHRSRVSYLIHKPTAFAAQLIHSGRPQPIETARAEAERLRADPDVEWVVVNEILKPASMALPAGGHARPAVLAEQVTQGVSNWLQPRNTTDRAGLASIQPAWDVLVNSGVQLTPPIVAVLDSGILTPPGLAGRFLPGYDFVSELEYTRDGSSLDDDPTDPGDWLAQTDKDANPQLYGEACEVHPSHWHGLAVSNILAGKGGETDGGAGILAPIPGQVVLPVRVGGICGAGLSDIIEGMLWAAGIDYQGSPPPNAYPARIINISYGGSGSCTDPNPQSGAWLYRQTIAQLHGKGVLVVASAGNGDKDGYGLATLSRPANCDGVLAVTGLAQDGYKALYANLVEPTKDHALAVASGDVTYDAVAKDWVLKEIDPGTYDGIRSVTNTGKEGPSATFEARDMAGTSFAAPTAAGVAALMLAVAPNLSVDELLHILKTSVAAFPATVVGRPVCDVGSTTEPAHCMPVCSGALRETRSNCYCANTGLCGSGILDAKQAVTEALLARANTGATASSSPQAVASYFTPDRLKPPPSSGGGGGAMDVIDLLALASALCLLMLTRLKGDRP